MASARLETYKQGFGADVFVWYGSTRIQVVVGWGMVCPAETVAWELGPDDTRKEKLRRWAASDTGAPIPADEAMCALGYDHLIVPPWLDAVVRSADEIR